MAVKMEREREFAFVCVLVLVKLSVLAKSFARKTPLRTPIHGKESLGQRALMTFLV